MQPLGPHHLIYICQYQTITSPTMRMKFNIERMGDVVIHTKNMEERQSAILTASLLAAQLWVIVVIHGITATALDALTTKDPQVKI